MAVGSPPEHPLTVGDRIGLAFVVESAVLSLVSTSLLLLWIISNSLLSRRRSQVVAEDEAASQTDVPRSPIQAQSRQSQPRSRWRFFRSGVDYYIVALLISDIIQALGSILHIRWTSTGIVRVGTYCTSQAVLKQGGDVGVALLTMAIAVHSWTVIFFRSTRPPSKRMALGVIAVIVIFIMLIIVIPPQFHKTPRYFAIAGSWCWINSGYLQFEIGLEYAFLWLSAVVGLACNVVSFYVIRGNIVVEYNQPFIGGFQIPRVSRRSTRVPVQTDNGDAGPNPPLRTNSNVANSQATRIRMAAAYKRLWFPFAYLLVITPLSVVRFISLGDPKFHNPAAISFGAFLFNLSGLVNTVLYIWTRPDLLAPLRRTNQTGPDRERNVVMQGVTQRSGRDSSTSSIHERSGQSYSQNHRSIRDLDGRTSSEYADQQQVRSDEFNPYANHGGAQYEMAYRKPYGQHLTPDSVAFPAPTHARIPSTSSMAKSEPRGDEKW